MTPLPHTGELFELPADIITGPLCILLYGGPDLSFSYIYAILNELISVSQNTMRMILAAMTTKTRATG